MRVGDRASSTSISSIRASEFVKEVRAQVYLSSVWQACIADKVKDVAGAYGSDIAPAGHAVVKVAPGGGTFKVFVLDATDESMRIVHVRNFRSSILI